MAPDARTPPGQISTRTVYQSKWMSVREDTYTQPIDLLIFPGPTITVSRSKRVWVAESA